MGKSRILGPVCRHVSLIAASYTDQHKTRTSPPLVVLASVCPGSSWTVRIPACAPACRPAPADRLHADRSYPSSRRCVAKEWRKVRQVACLVIPAGVARPEDAAALWGQLPQRAVRTCAGGCRDASWVPRSRLTSPDQPPEERHGKPP